jgi:hypothetical protein
MEIESAAQSNLHKETSMIRKAKAVWRDIGRAGSGNLSTGSSVLLETLCLLKNDLAQWGQAGACPCQIHAARRSYR